MKSASIFLRLNDLFSLTNPDVIVRKKSSRLSFFPLGKIFEIRRGLDMVKTAVITFEGMARL
jgi:hypothetical protein